jgi:Na+-transporting NADH:ubiquinone oxidoreductase subunit NqrD
MSSKNSFIGYLFRFFHRPLTTLSAAALLVVASSRLAFAIIAMIDVTVVYLFTALISEILRRVRIFKQSPHEIWLLPKKNQKIFCLFLSNFIGCIFFFVLYCISPLLALETIFITLFVTMFVYLEEAGEKYSDMPLLHIVKKCFTDSAFLGILAIFIALIREPIGYATLSLPGGNSGIIELFNKDGSFPFTVEIISLSSGAFLLIGFIMTMFRIIDRRKTERT